jgi:hypothetical protein
MGDFNTLKDELLECSNNIHRMKQEFSAEIMKLAKISADLIAASDSYKVKAADETGDESKLPKARVVKYDAPVEPSLGAVVAPVTARMEVTPKLAKGKRACSICRNPGHRAFNCPEADKAYKAARR